MAYVPLPQVQSFDVNDLFRAYSSAYQLGDAQRKRNVLLEAGAAAASDTGGYAPSLTPGYGGAPALPQGGTMAPSMGAQPGAMGVAPADSMGDGASGYSRGIGGAENSGRLRGRNPNSSAAGLGQFIKPTWLAMVKKYEPQTAAGKTDAQILALRETDRGLNNRMIDAYGHENAGMLSASGLPSGPAEMSLAHFAGIGGAKNILRADPRTPVSQLMTPAAMASNPFLRGKTAGDVRAWAAKRIGGVQTADASGGATIPSAAGGGSRKAANVLLRGGELDAAYGIQGKDIDLQRDSLKLRAEQEAITDARETKRWAVIGDIALYADTPEKWSVAIAAAKRNGIDTNGIEDFSNREIVLARSDRMKLSLELKAKQRAAQIDTHGTTLVPGEDAEGNPILLQAKKSGGADIVQIPGGGHPLTAQDKAHQMAEGKEEGKLEGSKPMRAAKAQDALTGIEQQHGIVLEDIGRATAMINGGLIPKTGVFSYAKAVPGTPQYDLARLLDTVKANIGFDKLQAMRDASPTGGALGQVSDFENRLLQSVFGSLEVEQSGEQLLYNLQRVQRVLGERQAARRAAYQRDFGDVIGAGAGAATAPAPAAAAPPVAGAAPALPATGGAPAPGTVDNPFAGAPAAPAAKPRLKFDANGNLVQ